MTILIFTLNNYPPSLVFAPMINCYYTSVTAPSSLCFFRLIKASSFSLFTQDDLGLFPEPSLALPPAWTSILIPSQSIAQSQTSGRKRTLCLPAPYSTQVHSISTALGLKITQGAHQAEAPASRWPLVTGPFMMIVSHSHYKCDSSSQLLLALGAIPRQAEALTAL